VQLCLVRATTFCYLLLCSMWLELCLSLTSGDKQKVTDVVTETCFFGRTCTSSARLSLILGALSMLARSKLFLSVEASAHAELCCHSGFA
jgi:hypothetical protein